ncbi:MAG: hypothetical protein WBK55_01790 [Alphaproteobacteria bacterium]
MAAKKAPAKKEAAPKTAHVAGKPEKRKSARGAKVSIFMIGIVIMAAVFLPSSVLLAVGMMPTFVALFTDTRRARTKVVTVGALNLAGCVPFLFKLWGDGHEFDNAVRIVSDPQAIIVMYAAAGAGYMIDWSMSAAVAAILYQRGLARQEAIRKRQEELTLRWGPEVTGQMPLDEYGFAIQPKEH